MPYTAPAWVNGSAPAINATNLLALSRAASAGYHFFNVKHPDYGALGDGATNDRAAIQAAIDAASSAGGGIAYVPRGTFVVGTSALSVPSNVTLAGSGRLTTTLKTANSTQINCVVLATSGDHQCVRDLTIDCNKANQSDSGTDGNQCGIYGSTNSSATIQTVTVKNSIREGFYISNGGWCYFGDLYAEACNRSGFEVDAMTYTDVVGFRALNGTTYGLRVVGAGSLATATGPVTVLGGMAYGNNIGLHVKFARGTRVVGFKARQNTDDGILVQDSGDAAITGCVSDLNERHGIYLLAADNCQVVGNNCRNNNRLGAKSGDGIHLHTALDNVIIGNRCNDTQSTKTQAYGIEEESAASNDRNLFMGNNLRDNNDGSLIVSGTNSVAVNNITSASLDIASAATITLGPHSDYFNITGTTTITSVTASYAGRRVTLKFAGALTFTDGSNLILNTAAGNFSTSADDTISLVCDGTNWYELARSAN